MQQTPSETWFTTTDLIALPLALAFLLFAIFGWLVAIKRLKAGQPMLPLDRVRTPIGFIDLALMFALWIGSQLAVVFALILVVGPAAIQDAESLMTEHGSTMLLLSGVCQLFVFALGAGYLLVRYRSANSFGWRLAGFANQVKIGVIAFTMIFPFVLGVQFALAKLVEYEHPVLDALAAGATPFSIFATWTAAVFAAPLAEEFFFRGVLHNLLERISVSPLHDNHLLLGGDSQTEIDRVPTNEIDGTGTNETPLAGLGAAAKEPTENNPYAAPAHQSSARIATNLSQNIDPAYWPIFVSSLFFALVHIGQGLAPVPLFILAIGLGYVFRQTGSLIACWTMHLMLNFYSMFIFTISILLGDTP